MCYTTFITTFASGIYSPAVQTISAEYHVAPEVATLGVTLYVLGFAFGYVCLHPWSHY
jgi:DHA1 family multidrug resistance protein-like MFS transporter